MRTPLLDARTYGGLSVAVYVAYRRPTDDEFNTIKNMPPALHKRARSAMSRLNFVDDLRYSYQFDETDYMQCINIADLETYLLCTCLDTLSGRDNYYDLQSWLKAKKIKEEMLGSDTKQRILENYDSRGELFSISVFRDALTKILDAYNRNYGVNQNIRQLILSLPNPVKSAIANKYILYKGNEEKGKRKWEQKSVDEKLKTIFVNYVFRSRRNKFTHEGTGYPSIGGICMARDRLSKGYFDLPESKSVKVDDLSVECKYGDEALFLREVISACLANVLGVLRDDWISLYRQAERQKRILYALVSEIKYNIKVMQGYNGVLAQTLTVGKEGSPKFDSTVARAFINQEGTSLPIWDECLREYVESITHFNEKVDSVSPGRTSFVQRSEEVVDLIEESGVRSAGWQLWRISSDLISRFPSWTSGYQNFSNFADLST